VDDTSVSPVDREVVRDFLSRAEPGPEANNPEGDKRLVIYGAGGHGRALAALVRDSEDYQIVGFLDDGLSVGTQVDDWQVLGGGEKLTELAQAGIHLAINGVGGITDRSVRLSVYDQLSRAGFHCPTVIHRTSFLEDSCDYADGVQIFPFVYVGTQVKVGYGCILNTGTIVSHDCTLADYVTLSPGATLAGGVTIGEATLIGMRATVNLDLHIGKRAVIGNGATVKADVPDECVVHAGTIWPPRH
jgi:UDP-perosamine 4-acetyltransferase